MIGITANIQEGASSRQTEDTLTQYDSAGKYEVQADKN
jgi:hypothetical protein